MTDALYILINKISSIRATVKIELEECENNLNEGGFDHYHRAYLEGRKSTLEEIQAILDKD